MEKTESRFSTRMQEDVKEALLNEQTECTFIWSTREGNGLGTPMSFLWNNNRVWVTTNAQRPRIKAIKNNPRVSVVISSAGTSLGNSRGISLQGEAKIHALTDVSDWFLPAYCQKLLPSSANGASTLATMLQQPGQVVVEVIPDKWICYDGQSLMDNLAAMGD